MHTLTLAGMPSFPRSFGLEEAGQGTEGPDLRLDPLLVSSSDSLESRYEESESDSSLLTSSEFDGRTEELLLWVAAAAVVAATEDKPVVFFPPPPAAARRERERGLLDKEEAAAATPPPPLFLWPRPLTEETLPKAFKSSYFSGSICNNNNRLKMSLVWQQVPYLSYEAVRATR